MTFEEFFHYRILTISNIISFLRIIAIPPLGFYMYQWAMTENPRTYMISYSLLALMILSDWLDGFLARLLGQETPLGQYLDPIADKACIIVTMILLKIYFGYPLWLTILVIIREVVGTWFGAFLLFKRNVMGKPNWWGKTGVATIAFSGVAWFDQHPMRYYTILPILITMIASSVQYFYTYGSTIFSSKNQFEI